MGSARGNGDSIVPVATLGVQVRQIQIALGYHVEAAYDSREQADGANTEGLEALVITQNVAEGTGNPAIGALQAGITQASGGAEAIGTSYNKIGDDYMVVRGLLEQAHEAIERIAMHRAATDRRSEELQAGFLQLGEEAIRIADSR